MQRKGRVTYYDSETEQPTVETKEEDLAIFIEEFYKWVHLFGLYSIRFEFQIGDTEGSYASYCFDYPSKTCGVTLTENNLPEGDDRESAIRDSAMHEFIEGGLLGPLYALASDRGFDEEEMESVVHSLVYRLQFVLRKIESPE